MQEPLEQQGQLSFEVKPHPSLDRVENPILGATVSMQGKLNVGCDLNAGDEVTVTVANADGEVIAQGVCEALHPTFADIKLDGDVIGTERVHKVKVAK